MDMPLRDELPQGDGNSRRQFLQQLVTAGAMVTAAAALPAVAQENAERPRTGNGSPDRRGSVAETLADYAVKLRYEDLPGDVVRTAKRTILDTIGCAIGGRIATAYPDSNKGWSQPGAEFRQRRAHPASFRRRSSRRMSTRRPIERFLALHKKRPDRDARIKVPRKIRI